MMYRHCCTCSPPHFPHRGWRGSQEEHEALWHHTFPGRPYLYHVTVAKYSSCPFKWTRACLCEAVEDRHHVGSDVWFRGGLDRVWYHGINYGGIFDACMTYNSHLYRWQRQEKTVIAMISLMIACEVANADLATRDALCKVVTDLRDEAEGEYEDDLLLMDYPDGA